MKRLLITAILASLAAFSMGATCRTKPSPAPIEPKDTKDCPLACEHLRALGCPEGEPLEDGTTCEKFCKDTQESGHALRPSCVITITSCDQIDECTGPPREVLE